MPVVFWGGGVIEEEAIGFLRHYWSAHPLQRVFDVVTNDFYQGRELSYAIDCLDAQWIRALLSRGVFLFVAPSVLLASLAFVPIGLWLVPTALPGLGRAGRWLVLLLYLGNFAVASTSGLLYRATKPLVAPLLVVLLLLLLAEYRNRRPQPARGTAATAVFVTALLSCLLDRQGLFYVLVLLVVLGTLWLRTRWGLVLVLATGAAVAVCMVYNYWLGPWLIHRLNGYWPDESFQRLDPRWLLAPGPWLMAARMVGDWCSVLLGGVPAWLLLTGAAAATIRWGWTWRRRPARLLLGVLCLSAAAIGQLAMVAVMAVRHEPVTWIDHRFWYYPLPFQALLLVALLWGLERLVLVRGRLPRGLPMLLAVLVVANVAQWPEHRCLMRTGPWFSDVERRSHLLVRSWRSGRAELLLDGEYRPFYFETLSRFPRLAARSGDHVGEGDGVGLAEVRQGRLVAPVRRVAHLPVSTTRPGRHVLVGGVHLSPGTTLSILLGPRPLAELHADAAWDGVRRFRIATDLAAGRSDLVLLARRTTRGGEGGRGFEVLLPFLVWRDEAARADTNIF